MKFGYKTFNKQPVPYSDFIALTDGSLYGVDVRSDLVSIEFKDESFGGSGGQKGLTAVIDVCLVDGQLIHLFNDSLVFF